MDSIGGAKVLNRVVDKETWIEWGSSKAGGVLLAYR